MGETDHHEMLLTSIDSAMQEQLSLQGLEINEDGNVDWAKTSLLHPRNWNPARKGYDIGLIIFLDFFTTAISAAGTPASTYAMPDFHISQTLSLFSFTSIYLVGQGLGGLLFSPYSESFGRRTLYIVAAFFYSIFCVLVGAAPNVGAVIAGRFITGLLSAIPSVVVSGSIEDLYDSEARIWMFFAWSVIVNVSLVMGPIYASSVMMVLSWNWVFYIASIVIGILSLLLLTIRESRPSHILNKKVTALQKLSPKPVLHIATSSEQPSLRDFVSMALIRPPLLFFTEPIVALTSILSSVVFALIYLLTAAVPIVYGDLGLGQQTSMLILLFVAIGFLLSVLTRFYDRHVARKRRRANMPLSPEDKLFGFVIAAPILAASLWWFAWTIPPLVHNVPWIASALALIPLGYATNEFDTVLGGYLADSYTSYAASAFTGLASLRAILSAVFPLFTVQLFTGLGSNVASSILAAVATLFCVVPVLFVRYGAALRGRSQFARMSMEDKEESGDGRGELVMMLERERARPLKRQPTLPTYRGF